MAKVETTGRRIVWEEGPFGLVNFPIISVGYLKLRREF